MQVEKACEILNEHEDFRCASLHLMSVKVKMIGDVVKKNGWQTLSLYRERPGTQGSAGSDVIAI